MKKYLFLYTITAVAVAAILISGRFVNAAVTAEIYVMEKTTGEQLVSSGGRLQYGAEAAATEPQLCLIGDYYVKNGAAVKTGDPVVEIYELTSAQEQLLSGYDLDKLLTLAGNAGLSGDILSQAKSYAQQKTVSAPRDGVVSGISYAADDIVPKNTPLFKIADNKSYTIPVNINEAYIERIQKGQPVRIKFTAIEEKQFSGTVTGISNEAKVTSGMTGKETSVEVTIRLKDTDSRLRIGYSAECSILTAKDENRLILPYEYICSEEEDSTVMIVRSGRARRVKIQTGTEYKNGVEITGGLQAGDQVIKNWHEFRPGQLAEESIGEANA